MLLTCTAAAVACIDRYTPCSTVDTRLLQLPMMAAAARRSAAGTPLTSCTRSGVHCATVSFTSSNPSVCAAMNSGLIRPLAMSKCCRPFSTATLLPARGARCTVAWRAVAVRRGSITTSCGGRSGAEAGAAVHVRRAEPGLADHAEGVILLEKQLAGAVKADGAGAVALDAVPRAGDDQRHGLVPARGLEPAVATDQRGREAGWAVVRLPAVQTLGTEAAVIDAVLGAAAHADDATVLHADVEAAAVGAQHAGRLHPLGRFGFGVHIDPGRPFVVVGVAWSPNIVDAVAAFHVTVLLGANGDGCGKEPGGAAGE